MILQNPVQVHDGRSPISVILLGRMHGTRTGDARRDDVVCFRDFGCSSRPWAQGHGRVALTDLFSAIIIPIRRSPSRNWQIQRLRISLNQGATTVPVCSCGSSNYCSKDARFLAEILLLLSFLSFSLQLNLSKNCVLSINLFRDEFVKIWRKFWEYSTVSY